MGLAPEATSPRAAAETAEHLFHEHSGWIYGYCLRVLRSPEEAEDALQTTYLNACRSLNQGTEPRAGSAWLLRIAKNVCFARLRSSGRRGKVERPQDITVLQETVAAPERSDELMGLVDALERLPERQRMAILLREWQGLSYREVADQLGVTQASVETLIFRARRSLAETLEGQRNGRRSLYALDLGGILAALKGVFAGSAGVKSVATLAVAAATTATVVATDPAGVWFDRSPPSAETARSTQSAMRPATGSGSADIPPLAPDETYRFAPALETRTPGADRGRAHGQATAAAAKAKGDGNAKGKAIGQTKTTSPPTSSSAGGGPRASGRPDSAGQSSPRPQAEAPQAEAQPAAPAKQENAKRSR
jgi:RNA polymerase sigma factor (sigma-70 family)